MLARGLLRRFPAPSAAMGAGVVVALSGALLVVLGVCSPGVPLMVPLDNTVVVGSTAEVAMTSDSTTEVGSTVAEAETVSDRGELWPLEGKGVTKVRVVRVVVGGVEGVMVVKDVPVMVDGETGVMVVMMGASVSDSVLVIEGIGMTVVMEASVGNVSVVVKGIGGAD